MGLRKLNTNTLNSADSATLGRNVARLRTPD
jgi:hypothetical protein